MKLSVKYFWRAFFFTDLFLAGLAVFVFEGYSFQNQDFYTVGWILTGFIVTGVSAMYWFFSAIQEKDRNRGGQTERYHRQNRFYNYKNQDGQPD